MEWVRQMLRRKMPAVAAREVARVFRVPPGVRVYAVGDVHGRGDVMARMLAAIAADAQATPCREVIEVFLGDYIDRGMQSDAVIAQLLAPPPAGHTRVCLMGNHEETLLRFLEDPNHLRAWGNMGGYATLAAYGIGIPASMEPHALVALRDQLLQRMPEAHVTFLQQLQLSYQAGDYLFVHAGIDPRRPWAQQTREHLLWIRNPFLNYEAYHEHYIVHGHSPVSAPDIRHNRANLDVSGASVDQLSCLVIQDDQRRCLLATREGVDLLPIK